MKYPDDVLTKTKKGDIEARVLTKEGEFVIYHYIHPETGKPSGEKKKLVLKSGNDIEAYFLIPLKDGRTLMIKDKDVDENIKIWDGEKPRKLFE